MSLFIATLAFGAGALLDVAKLGVIAASVVSGITGYTLLRFLSPQAREAGGSPGDPGG